VKAPALTSGAATSALMPIPAQVAAAAPPAVLGSVWQSSTTTAWPARNTSAAARPNPSSRRLCPVRRGSSPSVQSWVTVSIWPDGSISA
jgi:hypothetical protein